MGEYNYAILISDDEQVIGTIKMEKGSNDEISMVDKCIDDGVKIYKLTPDEYFNLEIN
jgi:hypothetical protein